VFLAVSFCALFAPMLGSPWTTVSLVIYAIELATVLVSGFETGRRDPVDPYIHMSEEELEGTTDLLKCSACVSRVNKLSRHCLICDKCVVDYDHHCKWLNNCIGERNYRTFICLIFSTLLLVGTQVIVGVVLFVKYVGKMDQLQADLSSASISINETVYFCIVCGNILVGLGACMMVAHLVSFHIYLVYHGLTTYNYVMQQQAAEESKRKSDAYLEEETESDSEEASTDDEGVSPTNEGEEAVDEKVLSNGSTSASVDDVDKKVSPTLHMAESDADLESGTVQQASVNIPGQPSEFTELDIKADTIGSAPLRKPIRLAPLDHDKMTAVQK